MNTEDDYDAEADFLATGRVRCESCGTRVRTRSLETLPPHDCTQRARERAASEATGSE